ncbi:DUF983 domain-containing protein [Parasphingopyxis marina]|uniref:DUF983 domain-containing protein n=1 Tax=Parasphingopyxis marina TaxID=2761622 RepID=A0A842I3Q7_9SPHN|nr:DUF983 domain-containing protein [Parasphingopyxis marina]MBC2779100.1 DUF983 domain-containing protein [Parasphingopyxis marina]
MDQVTPLATGLTGACPRCGARTLFAAPTRFADSCGACGLAYSSFNVGDGPAAFLTLVIGALVVVLALTVELSLGPPFWVHILLWVPFTVAAVVFGLRIGKGMLLALEYRNAAREGRIAAHDDSEE